MPDIFDQVADQQQTTQTAPQVTPQQGGDIFDQVAAQPQRFPQATPKHDVFDEATGDVTPEVSDPDESTVSKVWHWVNTPLLDVTQLGHGEGALGSVEKGAEEFASGLTSPLSIALMIGTAGLGSLAEGAGAATLESLSPEIAKVITPAANTISKLLNAGFTGQQIYSVARAVPEVSDAIREGDTDRAFELGTQAILSGVAAYASAKHLAKSMGATDKFAFPGDKEAIGAHQQAAELANLKAKNFEEANQVILRDKNLDKAAQLYHEAGGDVSTLEQQRQEILNSPKVNDKVKGQYDVLLKLAQNLPEDVKAVSDKVREDYAEDFRRGQQIGLFNPEVNPPEYAYRSRDVGEEGAPSQSHSQAAMSLAEIQRLTESRGDITKNPQEIVRVDLNNTPHQKMPGPNGVDWVKFRQDVPESALERLVDGRWMRLDPDTGKMVPVRPTGWFENYAGQHQYVPDDADASNVRPSMAGGKSPEFTKSRSFPTLVDAIKEGYEPTQEGLVTARGRYIRQFGQAEGLRNAEEILQSTKADDSAPVAVDPSKVRTISGTYADGSKASGVRAIVLPDGADIQALTDSERLIKDEFGRRYVDVSDYRDGPDKFDSYRIRGGNTPVYTEEGNRAAIFDKANLLIHPDYIKSVEKAFDDHSWFKQNSITSGLLKASTQAKQTLLSFSPFHWNTEFLRGIQMGLSPLDAIKPPEIDPGGLAMTQGTRHGLTLLGDTPGKSMFDEGVASSAYINRIPFIGPMLERASQHLFGDYIPRLKAATYEKVVNQLRNRLPDASDAEIHSRASEITNAAYGGLNYRQLGIDMSSRDALRLVMLAPDFTGSQLLFAKAGLQPGGSVVWQSMATMALYNAAVAQTLNLLKNGKTDMSHPFSVQSEDGKQSYSVRTMPSDLYHAFTDPRSFAANRLNPIVTRPAIESLSGKDQSGRNASYDRQLADLFKNITPISAQGILFRRPDQTVGSQMLRGVGIGTTPNRSVAEQKAIELSSARGAQGAIPQGELERHQLANQLTDQLRNGKIQRSQIGQAVKDGRITLDTAQRIIRNAAMPPLMAHTAGLDLKSFMDVFEVATPNEQAVLRPEFLKKVQAFRQREFLNKTPEQRLYYQQRIDKLLGASQQANAA